MSATATQPTRPQIELAAEYLATVKSPRADRLQKKEPELFPDVGSAKAAIEWVKENGCPEEPAPDATPKPTPDPTPEPTCETTTKTPAKGRKGWLPTADRQTAYDILVTLAPTFTDPVPRKQFIQAITEHEAMRDVEVWFNATPHQRNDVTGALLRRLVHEGHLEVVPVETTGKDDKTRTWNWYRAAGE